MEAKGVWGARGGRGRALLSGGKAAIARLKLGQQFQTGVPFACGGRLLGGSVDAVGDLLNRGRGLPEVERRALLSGGEAAVAHRKLGQHVEKGFASAFGERLLDRRTDAEGDLLNRGRGLPEVERRASPSGGKAAVTCL